VGRHAEQRGEKARRRGDLRRRAIGVMCAYITTNLKTNER